jgi:FtsZ-binding cell division protein ZapB
MKSNVTPSTKVTHPSEPDAQYSISRMRYVEETGAVQSIDIIRKAYGHVFTGTVEQAEAQGFIFHVEPSEVTVEEINTLLGPDLEPQPLPLTDLPEVIARLEGEVAQNLNTITTLQNELSKANDRVTQFHARCGDAERTLEEFRVSVRDSVIAAMSEHTLCKEGVNSFLESLDLDPIKTGFMVTVETPVGTVIGCVEVSGDDCQGEADRAIEYVKERIESEIDKVDVDMTITITGSEDSNSEQITTDDDALVSDSWIDSYIENLTFTTEEI